MKVMSGRPFLLLMIAAMALLSPSQLHAWQWEDSGLKRVPISSRLRLVAAPHSTDLDDDGIAETLTVTEGRATIQTESMIRWQSPMTWRVEQAMIADLNRDGSPEAALLVWRPFKPWPVDLWLPNGGRINSFHDSNELSCHMILIGWKQGSFRELWVGSAMADPVNRFIAIDLLGNGQQSLVALEGQYDDPPSAPSRRLKVWEWNGFGFTFVNELEEPFNLIAVAQTEEGRMLIFAD